MTAPTITQQQLSFLKMLCDQINISSFLYWNVPVILDKSQIIQEPHEIRENVPYMKNGSRYTNEQGIVCAQMTTEGHIILRLTSFAANFIEGLGDKQMQDLSNSSGAIIQSQSVNYVASAANQYNGVMRVFQLEGAIDTIHSAVTIIFNAVNRYRELISGAYRDDIVGVQQVIGGVEFEYIPPPQDAFPFAARTIHSPQQNFSRATNNKLQSPRAHVGLSGVFSTPSSPGSPTPYSPTGTYSLAPLLPPPHVANIVSGTMVPSMEETGPMRVINAGRTVPPNMTCEVLPLSNTMNQDQRPQP
eukprot:TRINITY_DN1655_c0_g3_i1.p1 TRINITY_DN1655_c0_g3~~TRINITY_DN1655_c0_g3_i1.p1  ORF type:complete len:302 (+),score=26.13 TRINITY_DN1655_c0_g3_i1:186-1091(+)